LDKPCEGRLRELDGWRAVSVLLVILHHLGVQHHRFVSHFPLLAIRLNSCGPLGVKVFFVISGFVICRLLISEEARYGAVSLRAFYYRRIFRILPPFYVYLGTLSLLLSLGLIHESRKAILDAALFLCDLRVMPRSWFVGHAWSLAVEEQFYLIFPGAWVLTPKRWRSKVFLGVFFLCAAWNLSMVCIGWDPFVYSITRTGFACIACGVVMTIEEKRARSMANRVPAFIVAIVAITLLLHPIGPESWHAALYEGLLVPPAIGLVLLYSLGRGAWLRDFLCSRPMQAIGLTSYGIYLWQQFFTAPARENFPGGGRFVPLLLPLLCVIVPLSYFLIEKPAMRFGKGLSQRARAGSIDATAAA